MVVYYRHGNGQSFCKGCKEKKKWGLYWDCFMYSIKGRDGAYCRDCVNAIAAAIGEIPEFKEWEE